MIENLGTRIKDLRIKKGVSQKQLASALNLNTSTIVSAYEISDRTPSLKIIIKLAAYFNVTTDYLLGLSPQTPLNLDGLKSSDAEAIKTLINSLKSIR